MGQATLGGYKPDTRCDECGHKYNYDAEGPTCPKCDSPGRPIRSEKPDFGHGESTGIDEL